MSHFKNLSFEEKLAELNSFRDVGPTGQEEVVDWAVKTILSVTKHRDQLQDQLSKVYTIMTEERLKTRG